MSFEPNVLDELFKRLHLANARRVWRDLVQRAEKEQWDYGNILHVLAAEEVAQRQQTRLRKVTAHARFPFLKTIDDFDFTYQSTLRLQMLGSYLSADFVTEGRSLLLSGKPGRGKTHLAIAVAYRALQNGFDALFTTAAALTDDLSAASRVGRLREALATYVKPHVLVVDEVGYLTYGDDAANVLFHVVNERHLKKRAMIFTTNKALKAWGSVLHDDDLAEAIIDRILERGRHLKLDGPSIRTKHIDLDEATSSGHNSDADRVSGIEGTEFPEPTLAVGVGSPHVLRQLRITTDALSHRAPHPGVVAARRDLEHAAQDDDREGHLLLGDERELHVLSFAKKVAALFRRGGASPRGLATRRVQSRRSCRRSGGAARRPAAR